MNHYSKQKVLLAWLRPAHRPAVRRDDATRWGPFGSVPAQAGPLRAI